MPRTQKVSLRAHFLIFYENRKDMSRVVLDEESKTGHCFEIGQRQQKCWRKLKVQSLANPAVHKGGKECLRKNCAEQGGEI